MKLEECDSPRSAIGMRRLLIPVFKFLLGAINIYLIIQLYLQLIGAIYVYAGIRVDYFWKYLYHPQDIRYGDSFFPLPSGFWVEYAETDGITNAYYAHDFHLTTFQVRLPAKDIMCDDERVEAVLKTQGLVWSTAFSRQFYGFTGHYKLDNLDIFIFADIMVADPHDFSLLYIATIPQICCHLIVTGQRADEKLIKDFVTRSLFPDAQGELKLVEVF